MSTTTKYTNSLGENITEQQLPLVEDYSMNQYEDGILKKVEIYYNGELNYGTYYLATGEDKQAVVSELSEDWPDVEIYYNAQNFGEFLSRDWEMYRDGAVILRGKTVFDNLNRQIGRAVMNLQTLEVEETKKIFYLLNHGDFTNEDGVPQFGQFDFTYNEDSSKIKVVLNLPDYEFDQYSLDLSLEIFNDPRIAPLFTWLDHPYYHNAIPLIPNTQSV